LLRDPLLDLAHGDESTQRGAGLGFGHADCDQRRGRMVVSSP
jgi:hypothetical protein